MSLFDVIKYPISDPPTKQELEAVPEYIIRRWATRNGWMASTASVCEYYSRFDGRAMLAVDRAELKDLRKIIRRLP